MRSHNLVICLGSASNILSTVADKVSENVVVPCFFACLSYSAMPSRMGKLVSRMQNTLTWRCGELRKGKCRDALTLWNHLGVRMKLSGNMTQTARRLIGGWYEKSESAFTLKNEPERTTNARFHIPYPSMVETARRNMASASASSLIVANVFVRILTRISPRDSAVQAKESLTETRTESSS